MATGITLLPAIWTTQPQAVVSIGNDVSAKIIFLPCLGDVNLVNLEPFINTHSSLRLRKSIGVDGFRYQSDSLWAAGLTIAKNLPSVAEPCILLGVISPTELSTVGRYVCDRWIEAGTTSAYAGQFIVEQNATDLRLRYNDGSGSFQTLAFGLTLVVGGIYRFAIDVSVDAIKIYVNGIKTAEAAFSMPAIGASIPTFFRVFGRGAGAANTAFTGYEYFIGALQSGRAQQLSENPWQIFKKTKLPVFFSIGGITLTVNALSNAQSLESFSLTQQNTLAVNALNNAQSIDNIDLVTTIILSIADLANAQSLGNVDLIQQNTLSVNAENQAQSLGNVDLVQQNTLSVNAELQGQSLGNIDLVQQNTLAVNDENQAQSLGNVDLIQQNTLSVNNESQTQSLESPTLDTALSINIQNMANAQSLENITLVQQNILSVNPLYNTQALGNIDLTQANVLSINAILQDQNLENIALDFSVVLTISDIISQQVVDNISLVQANILSVYASSQGQTLSNVALTQQSTLIVNDWLHAQLLSNITLLDDAIPLIVSGSTVFVLRQDNGPVFVLSSKSDVFIKQSKTNVITRG